MPNENKALILYGAGGHCKVLVDLLKTLDREILFIVDDDPKKHGSFVFDVPVLGGYESILRYNTDEIELINAIGSTKSTAQRKFVFERALLDGYTIASLQHPTVIIAGGVVLSAGVQMMAGTILQTEVIIKNNVLLNTGVIIEHECEIGAHTHIATGAKLCGNVKVGEGVHIGAGAVVIQGIRIAKNATIAAGAVVIDNIDEGVIAAGVPARRID